MGLFGSDESSAVKTSDTTGNISNNIVNKNSNEFIEIMLVIISIFKLLEFAMIVYSSFIRKIKKRYNSSGQNV